MTIGSPDEALPPEKGNADVVRAARSLEWLKAELLVGTASLYRSLSRGGKDEDELLDHLADMLLHTYLLSRRLGIGLPRLDMRVTRKLSINVATGHQLEEWFGDLSAVSEHLSEHRGSVGLRGEGLN